MICFSMILGNLTIGQPQKIIKDFGLSAISLFGVLIAIFVGIGTIYKEIEKKTIYVILSRPISRSHFLLGKYFGLSLIILLQVILMTCFLLLLLVMIYEQPFPASILLVSLLTWIQIEIVLAVALFFSSFSTPFLSGIFTLSIFIIGNLVSDLKTLSAQGDNVFLEILAKILFYCFPNFERLNFTTQVVHNLPIYPVEIINSILYGCAYLILVLTLSMVIFSKRDIK